MRKRASLRIENVILTKVAPATAQDMASHLGDVVEFYSCVIEGNAFSVHLLRCRRAWASWPIS